MKYVLLPARPIARGWFTTYSIEELNDAAQGGRVVSVELSDGKIFSAVLEFPEGKKK